MQFPTILPVVLLGSAAVPSDASTWRRHHLGTLNNRCRLLRTHYSTAPAAGVLHSAAIVTILYVTDPTRPSGRVT
jgi:hypothetical protein